MLTGVHFLLTYKCTNECDHCFLYCSPEADGVFSIDKIKSALRQMKDVGSINSAYFEGGEPFLYYPLLVESLKMARAAGFSVGVVTNAYWAESESDALLWLEPLVDIGIADLSVSDDIFHNPNNNNRPRWALDAAGKLGIPSGSIRIEKPVVKTSPDSMLKGLPVLGGEVIFRGRAVDKLLNGLPRRHYSEFDSCPHEDLKNPSRVHLDPFGNVHICQGMVIGNINDKSLKDIMDEYEPENDPVIGSLLKGGPAELARRFNYDITYGFADHCHLCYEIRRVLQTRFPDSLRPAQVYG